MVAPLIHPAVYNPLKDFLGPESLAALSNTSHALEKKYLKIFKEKNQEQKKIHPSVPIQGRGQIIKKLETSRFVKFKQKSSELVKGKIDPKPAFRIFLLGNIIAVTGLILLNMPTSFRTFEDYRNYIGWSMAVSGLCLSKRTYEHFKY